MYEPKHPLQGQFVKVNIISEDANTIQCPHCNKYAQLPNEERYILQLDNINYIFYKKNEVYVSVQKPNVMVQLYTNIPNDIGKIVDDMFNSSE